MDLNYTQNFKIAKTMNFQVAADCFNIFNSQTGYDIEPSVHNSNFGNPRHFYDPRRLQVAARFQF
jgi:hypothetical protein